jgi:hypothetical protein
VCKFSFFLRCCGLLQTRNGFLACLVLSMSTQTEGKLSRPFYFLGSKGNAKTHDLASAYPGVCEGSDN